jgi:heme exporter protein D
MGERGGGGVFVWLLSGMTYIPVIFVHLTLNVYGRIEFQTAGDSVRQRYEVVDKYSFESWLILNRIFI